MWRRACSPWKSSPKRASPRPSLKTRLHVEIPSPSASIYRYDLLLQQLESIIAPPRPWTAALPYPPLLVTNHRSARTLQPASESVATRPHSKPPASRPHDRTTAPPPTLCSTGTALLPPTRQLNYHYQVPPVWLCRRWSSTGQRYHRRHPFCLTTTNNQNTPHDPHLTFHSCRTAAAGPLRISSLYSPDWRQWLFYPLLLQQVYR